MGLIVDHVVPRISIMTQKSRAFDSSLKYEKFPKLNNKRSLNLKALQPWNRGKIIKNNL